MRFARILRRSFVCVHFRLELARAEVARARPPASRGTISGAFGGRSVSVNKRELE